MRVNQHSDGREREFDTPGALSMTSLLGRGAGQAVANPSCAVLDDAADRRGDYPASIARFDLDAIRTALPVLEHSTYLNTGAAGPLPTYARDAMREQLDAEILRGRVLPDARSVFLASLETLRAEFARRLKAPPHSIAITDTTTHGLNIALWGCLGSGAEEILTTSFEHTASLAPLKAISDLLGAKVIVYQAPPSDFDCDAFMSLATSRTKALVISHVDWTSGLDIPLKQVSTAARERGILTIVDGAQAVGVIDVDIEDLGCDAYAFPGQKWLMGPEGIGGLYIRPASLEHFHLTYAGPLSFERHGGGLQFDLKADCSRFELGTRFRGLAPGMTASLRWLGEHVGVEAAQARLRHLRARLVDRLLDLERSRGICVIAPNARSGLVAIDLPPRLSAPDLSVTLAQRSIFIRAIPGPNLNRIRASTAFFNSEAELDRFVGELDSELRSI
ncbi:aminotransferase class V-fold PLP-dependent enzyme [Caulobacter sp. S45]|uniref:aminotransferase class V-fold PLP-dependent enzyme n=1 Tax=Caulobacter sp. S45 TaxID=1641861 RepID=UPI00131C22F9|nr:aminotransferase class V-fold PLP-dependent enzyme [Caulobacter sp. S45]